jgi:LytS/YehU family sensor histidine kinase
MRPGAGMALANLRSRLQTQFGANASLILQARDNGAEVVLDIPYRSRATIPPPPELAA